MENEFSTPVIPNRREAPNMVEAGDFVVGASPAMRAVERAIADLANCDVPVLLLGEAGTGKTALAQRIHAASDRKQMPFVKLNCASITPSFFEPVHAGEGDGGIRLASLPAGTLLVDEITDLLPACQVRFLEAFFDSMTTRSYPAVRLSMTSRRNLEQEVRQNRLREDLYYRVRGVCLQIPPLRHRREDILLLIEFFLDRYSCALERTRPQLTTQDLRVLLEHPWPGNVRQLKETANALVLGKPRRTPEDLRSIIDHSDRLLSLKDAAREASRQAERELILRVLARTRGNRKLAAEQLQISYKALLYKLKKIALTDRLPHSGGTTL